MHGVWVPAFRGDDVNPVAMPESSSGYAQVAKLKPVPVPAGVR
jgi:hypothetical protein